MDNITHTLMGLAIAKTRVGRMSPAAVPAVVFAANAPDLDAIVRWFAGPSAYLVHHRGITHSLCGILIQIPLIATLFWLFEHVLVARRSWRDDRPPDPAGPRSSWRGLCLAVACGIATQPVLDALNTYGWRPWLPFDHTRYYGDLAAIVDPWLWLVFGGAACLAGPRRRFGDVFYLFVAALGVLMIFSVGRAADAMPQKLRVAWLVLAAALVLARGWGLGRSRPHAVVAVAALMTAAYLSGLGLAKHAAWNRYGPALVKEFEPRETLRDHMLSPGLGNPLAWTLVAQTDRAVYRQRANLFVGAGPIERAATNLDDPRVRQALATADGRAWHYFARYPVARIEHNSPVRVGLLDARYNMNSVDVWCNMLIDLSAERMGRAPDGR